MESKHIDTYLNLVSGQRFKLWGVTGSDVVKRDNIIGYLREQGWSLVDVEGELTGLISDMDEGEEPSYDIGQKIKEWFHGKPDNLILVNSSILYHKAFLKMSPIGAFKYNSRNKNCVIFLEDEKLFGNRLYYGETGTEEYSDQYIHDVFLTEIKEIEENYTPLRKTKPVITDKSKLARDAIGHLFDYTEIKDVVDIDADLREKDSRRELVSSFIISESLERQITDFLDNLEKPNHKAVKIIGNYGSGKSHLIAFLISIITEPEIRDMIKNDNVREAAHNISRKFSTVQFELMPGDAEMSVWFYKEIAKQFKASHNLTIPQFTKDDINHKDNIIRIIETVKIHDPTAGLLVIMDEVSDFLAQKQPHLTDRDFQFLRIIGQVCQDQDLMVVTAMQEDIYSSPRFKAIAAQESRVSERFQNIIIHKEAVKKVIAERIVPKSANQKTEIENRLRPFSEKIEDVANRMEDYVNLFPFTPFLLNLFHELPYFEKRGVIQFAQNELKYALDEPFPFFLTFNKIFELLESYPNLRNMEEVYDLARVVSLIRQKINVSVESKFQADAGKLIEGLAVYALWSRGENGATAKELAENLLIIPQSKVFTAVDYISSIIQKIRNATDGFYLKIVKDTATGNDYFKLDPAIDGKDPEERIDTAVNTVSDIRIEEEFFDQVKDILELQPFFGKLRSLQNLRDVFEDECPWPSVKSFRKGYIIFARRGAEFSSLPRKDYAIAVISPYRTENMPKLCEHQLDIKITIDSELKIEALKRIAAIRELINRNILVSTMKKKLAETIDGTRTSTRERPGIKFRIARWFYASSSAWMNGESLQVQKLVREKDNLFELMYELKTSVFDKHFNEIYKEHPRYAQILSSGNILRTLSDIASELAAGDFTKLKQAHRQFLKNMDLLNSQNDPDISGSRLSVYILNIISSKKDRVTDIEKEIIAELAKAPYGIEPETVHLILILLTVIGKISLKARGGDTLDISNIREKFKSLAQFETIAYAILKDDLSYDFAQRLLNTLGLNGAKILQEKTRNEAFKEYKEKIAQLIGDFAQTQTLIDKAGKKPQCFIRVADVTTAYEKTQVTGWKVLDIANHAKFSSIEHLNSRLSEIRDAVAMQSNIREAMTCYHDTVHDGIEYMRQALEILDGNSVYAADAGLNKRLRAFFDDTMEIVKDISRFLDPSERLPIDGKIQSFKSAYVKDFYFPAHEKTVGKKVDWRVLESIDEHKIAKKIKTLIQLDCLVESKFDSHMSLWKKLLELRCVQVDVDKLCATPFCTYCNFMKTDWDYPLIQKEIDSADDVLEGIFDDYAQTIVAEVSKNIRHLELIDCPEKRKGVIRKIADTQKLPGKIGVELIRCINQLFKDFVIVELKKDELNRDFFREDELLTLEQLRKSFFDLEHRIKKKGRESEIRIKFV
ncbi:DUF6079 family protein [Desulfococcaceae bacterium HSG8]|nr:DUF6079 family protein [Desulfococcaceae bacterium HSG8]